MNNPPKPKEAPLTVRNGQLLRDGRPYRGIGLNITAIADDVLDHGPAARDSLQAIRLIGAEKIPFIRFWASYFSNHVRWQSDAAKYWKHMDLLIDTCESAGLGMAPTLFWNDWSLADELDEFRYAWGDPESRTRQYMERYVQAFVTRYRNRRHMWLYEYANESNLSWDLPNGMEFLPEGRKDARNVARAHIGTWALRAFGRAVRKHDAGRPINAGTSTPRPSQFHQATEDPVTGKPWAEDSVDQQYEASVWSAPDPIDLFSIHYYAEYNSYDRALVRRQIDQWMAFGQRMRKPLYIGEFAVFSDGGQVKAGFDDTAYRRYAGDLIRAVVDARVPLSAWWCYAGIPGHFGMGAINPSYARFDYLLGMLREANEQIN